MIHCQEDSDQNEMYQDNDEYTVSQLRNKKKKKVDFINERIVAALDAAKISDYKAMHIISAIAESLGHDINDLNISRSTLNAHRKKNRKTTANRIRENFSVLINSKKLLILILFTLELCFV